MSERDIVCYILLKDVSEGFTKGCLVSPRDTTHQVYILHHAHTGGTERSSCTCSEGDVAPLFADDYQYLCRIGEPRDRYEVFKSPYKLKWAKTLKCGERAYARLRRNLQENSEGKLVAVEIRWVGQTKIGTKFGVEIIDPAYKGQGDAGVSKYFKCAEKCGMLVDLDALECNKLLHPTVNWNTGAMAAGAESPPALSDTTTVKGGQNITDELKKENRMLQEENAAINKKYKEAEVQIAALQAQSQRQLNIHKSEIERVEEDKEEQIKLLRESELRLQNELIKKAENHAEELKEAFDSQQQLVQKREKEHQDMMQELNQYFQNEIKAAHHQWQQVIDRTWELERDMIEVLNITLGTGRLGTTMKGNFRGVQVAVKKFNLDLVSEQNEKLVKWEINSLAQVRHPNLVLFLGAVISAKDSSLIVTELMDMSLHSAYQQQHISAESKISILTDISSALAYLHTNRVPIIHRRVTSSRVLLKSIGGAWKAKLSIFTMANIIPVLMSSDDRTGLYAAPEVVTANRRHQTEKVDVYSFGVLVCEVVLCRTPPEEKEEFPIMLSDVHAKDHSLFQLAMNCTKLSHLDRPSMMEVVEQLREFTWTDSAV